MESRKMEEKIPENTELVIFDFYNTIVCLNSENILKLRNGAFGLLVRLKLKGKKTAIFSSSDIKEVLDFPDFLKIRDYVHAVYGKENIIEENNIKYKNLGQICKDLEIMPQKAVFIGDNYNDIDKRSAEKFGIDFIELPSGSDNPNYNLENLILRKK